MEKRYKVMVDQMSIDFLLSGGEYTESEIKEFYTDKAIESFLRGGTLQLIPEEPKEIVLRISYSGNVFPGMPIIFKKGRENFTEKEKDDMQEALNGKFQARIKELEKEVAGMFTRRQVCEIAEDYQKHCLRYGIASLNASFWLADRKENKVI